MTTEATMATPTKTKYFIHFHAGDAADDDGSERVYFETAAEARRAIRANGWERIAEVERAEVG